jgi:hypothetical protein
VRERRVQCVCGREYKKQHKTRVHERECVSKDITGRERDSMQVREIQYKERTKSTRKRVQERAQAREREVKRGQEREREQQQTVQRSVLFGDAQFGAIARITQPEIQFVRLVECVRKSLFRCEIVVQRHDRHAGLVGPYLQVDRVRFCCVYVRVCRRVCACV